MFFLPTGHDDQAVRRFPIWTLLLIVVNLLVWALTVVREHELEKQRRPLLQEAAELAGRNPELEVSEDLAYVIASDARAHWRHDHPKGAAESDDAAALDRLDEQVLTLRLSD